MAELKPIAQQDLPQLQPQQTDLHLIDSHCHLSAPAFDPDRGHVLQTASRAGVRQLIVIGAGYGADGARAATDLAAQHESIFFALGIHPHEAAQNNLLDRNSFIELAKTQPEKFVAVGEIGLDYHYDFAPAAEQRHHFCEQLKLANELECPFIIHTREAHDDTVDILNDHREQIGRFGGLIHCFSEGAQEAERYLELGLHLGIGGLLTFPKAETFRQTVKTLPQDRLVLETDAPYLTPVPKRGRRNEPACLLWVAQALAPLWGQTVEKVAETTTTNCRRLFKPLIHRKPL